jgi:hypothetical protein
MAEEFYYVDEETYSDSSLDDCPEARKCAENILKEWKKENGHRMILLKAQMHYGT